MRDGLYIVDHGSIYAAFVVRQGEVRQCAPILRKNLGFYKTIAQFIPTEAENLEPDQEQYPPAHRTGFE